MDEIAPGNLPKGRCPFGNPARGRCPLDARSGRCPDNQRRAFGPLDTHAGVLIGAGSLAGVTARDRRASTHRLRRGVSPPLWMEGRQVAPDRCMYETTCVIIRQAPFCCNRYGAKECRGRRLASGESAEGGSRKRSDDDRKALWSRPQARNPVVGATAPTPENPSMTHAEYGGA